MTSWHSYPSIYNLGHRAIRTLFDGPVDIEEKVDGSQFSFGLFYEEVEETTGLLIPHPRIRVRSKGIEFPIEAPQAMFKPACDTVLRLVAEGKLHPGYTYRAEAVCKPKHNALEYGRVPVGNLIVFDINPEQEGYLSYEAKKLECERLGLECVPLLASGMVSLEDLRGLLNTNPTLGGPHKIEGIVIKPRNRDLFGPDKKLLMGKFVSEAFKEVHTKAWEKGGEFRNFGQKDIIQIIGEAYCTVARWEKAIQHKREAGLLEGSPRDIGMLIKEIPDDILKECEDEIKERLFKWAIRDLRGAWTRGFPEYYKQKLMEAQFEEDHLGVVPEKAEPAA